MISSSNPDPELSFKSPTLKDDLIIQYSPFIQSKCLHFESIVLKIMFVVIE